MIMTNPNIKGEIAELKVLGILLSQLDNEKYDIYRPIVDIKGVDLIIRKLIDGISYYLELQIKSRTSEAEEAYLFARLKVDERYNYYFIFYSQPKNAEERMWLVPSTEIKYIASHNIKGDNFGTYTINDCSTKCNKYEVNMNKLSEKIDEIFEKLSTDSKI